MAERQKGLQTYLDTLVQQLELCNSLLIQRFLDPDNHAMNYSGILFKNSTLINLKKVLILELASQYIAMFIRSANNIYQIVEQPPEFGRNHMTFLYSYQNIFLYLGWRYNKTYFVATKTGSKKDERYLLTWVYFVLC